MLASRLTQLPTVSRQAVFVPSRLPAQPRLNVSVHVAALDDMELAEAVVQQAAVGTGHLQGDGVQQLYHSMCKCIAPTLQLAPLPALCGACST